MQQSPSDTSVIELESDRWFLQLQPAMGMQTRVCKIHHADRWHDFMPDCSATDAPLSAANFHMLPYSNRIRDGRFSHEGVTVQLEQADQHAIHGALRKQLWRVTEQTKTSATAEFDSRRDGKINWPWPIQATVNYALVGHTLTSQMTLTNHGMTSMPAGMGWHPYFCRTIAGASPKLTISAAGVYPDTDGDCLPTGAALNLPAQLDFNKARDLDANQRIDHCLSGFTSPAKLAWPDAGITVQMHASNSCSHLVLFNPDAPYFAVEPVTNANDGVNLANRGVDAGIVSLNAGQQLSAELKLQLITV